MTTAQQVIKRSTLINRRVIDRKTVEELGRVEQIWLYPETRQVAGLTCKSGFLGSKKQWFAWTQVESVGENILINLDPETPAPQQPAQLITALGSEVLTETGNKAGSIIDYLLDIKTGSVLGYLYKSSGWQGVLDGIYLLPESVITSSGAKGLIVQEAAVLEPQQYAEGLTQKISQAKDVLGKDLKHTLDDAEQLQRGTQKLAEELQKRAQFVRERAQVVGERAQDQAQVLRERAQDQAQVLRGKAQDQAQVLRERAQDQAQVLRGKAQELSEKAREKIEEVRQRREEPHTNVTEQTESPPPPPIDPESY